LTYDSLRLIFAPFGKNEVQDHLVNTHRDQLSEKEENIRNALGKVIPNQTWQYYKGKVAINNSNHIITSMLMITNRKNLNRADIIDNIGSYSEWGTISKFGGKVIHSLGVLREMLFEVGKLPKFGA